jgi:hypothetical protein
MSRPQMSHAYGSYVRPDGSASDATPSATEPTAATIGGAGVLALAAMVQWWYPGKLERSWQH